MKYRLALILSMIVIFLTGCTSLEKQETSNVKLAENISDKNIVNVIEDIKSDVGEENFKENKHILTMKAVLDIVSEKSETKSEIVSNYIGSNKELFPAILVEGIEKTKGIVDITTTTELINKDIEIYQNRITSFKGKVKEHINENIEGMSVNVLMVEDQNKDKFVVIITKRLDQIEVGDNIRFFGTPASLEKDYIVFFGSHIDKEVQ